jgi:hypothetical protein
MDEASSDQTLKMLDLALGAQEMPAPTLVMLQGADSLVNVRAAIALLSKYGLLKDSPNGWFIIPAGSWVKGEYGNPTKAG